QFYPESGSEAYTQVHIVWGRNEDLETSTYLHEYDIIGITDTWWDGSDDWSPGMEELCLGIDEELTGNLRVKIKGRGGTGDVIVWVCYRPPDQEGRVDEALYRQIGAASHLQALVLMEDFNHLDVCWRENMAGHKQFRKFLKCVDDNFLLQVIKEPTRRSAVLDLVLTNKEELVGVSVLHSLVLGSGGPEVASLRSCWKFPPCPAEPVPDGSEDGRAAGQDWAN
ncbi:hypothetical protein HGM15179_019577, partial [Zosterops borbonicus]